MARHDLVALGMLLGCDYTTGVKGVGIVNAMEILDAFPANGDENEEELLSGLRAFRDWHALYDPVTEALAEANKSSFQKSRNKTKRAVAAVAAALGDANDISDVGEKEAETEDEEEVMGEESSAGSKSSRIRFEEKHRNARYFVKTRSQ